MVATALPNRLCSFFNLSPSLLSRPLPSRRGPSIDSLLILPKHIILFALHVLKVKVAPGHAFVDVLDVIAGGLKVSGGIIGPRGKDLDKTGVQAKINILVFASLKG